jgi:hypothetical protein
MYVMRASFHSGISITPGAMAFHHDMVLNIPFVADLNLIQENQQQLIDQRLIASIEKMIP